jgi:hypothetical protein
MGAKPYAPQSWSDNEPIFTDKLNAMANNDQWLFENMANVYYNGHGVKKAAGVKILTAAVSIPPNSKSGNGSRTFYFGNFFSSGCQPFVIASINSYPQGRFHLSTRGIGTFWPDHRGFEVRISVDELNAKSNKINATVWVPFIAIGW